MLRLYTLLHQSVHNSLGSWCRHMQNTKRTTVWSWFCTKELDQGFSNFFGPRHIPNVEGTMPALESRKIKKPSGWYMNHWNVRETRRLFPNPSGAYIKQWTEACSSVQGGLISPVLFSLYVNDMPKPSHHVELALYADDTAIIATSRTPVLLVSYLQAYLSHLERWLTEWRIAINVSKSSAIIFARAGRRFIQPRSVTLFGEPINWVDTVRYLGVTLDKRLTWSPHIEQVSRRTAQRMGLLGPLLNRRSDLSIRNGVLLYKQLIRPLMDYACPAWRSAARTHVRRLQVLQSKCLRLVTGAPWYLSNRQIHEDLSVPFSPTTSEP